MKEVNIYLFIVVIGGIILEDIFFIMEMGIIGIVLSGIIFWVKDLVVEIK